MSNCYIIDGGIGKQVAFSALIPALKKRDKSPILVYSPYTDVYANNPDVKQVYDANSIPLNYPDILKCGNYYFCEPYKSNFVKGNQHIIESFCEGFRVKYSKNMRPKMYTDFLKENAKIWLSEKGITEQFMIIQFTGGQSPVGFNQNKPYASIDPGRNYPPYLAQEVVNLVKQKYPDIKIINYSLHNEPHYEGTIKWTGPWSIVHEVMKNDNCQGFIGVDSSLNHIAASAELKGVVIWGSTRSMQFGYDQNRNLTFFDHYEPNFVYNSVDPRNIMVDPGLIFENYLEIVES